MIDEQQYRFISDYVRTGRFTNGTPRNIRAIGELVLFLRADPDNGQTGLWVLDTNSGNTKLLVDASSLQIETEENTATKAARERARDLTIGIQSYNLDAAGAKACFTISNQVYVVDISTGKLATVSTGDSEVFDARLSPDGKKIAFTDQSNFKVAATHDQWESNEITALFKSDDPDTFYGKADFIAAEEIGRSQGYWWLPNSEQLIVTKVDQSGVTYLNISNPADAFEKPKSLRYPQAGSDNSITELYATDLDGNANRIHFETSIHSQRCYLVDVYAEDIELTIRTQNRSQTCVTDLKLDLESLSCSESNKIESQKWVDLVLRSRVRTEAGLAEIISTDDARTLNIAGTALDTNIYVRSIVGVTNSHLFFTGSSDPMQTHLFKCDLDSRDITQLTDNEGIHDAVVSDELLVVTSRTMDSTKTSTNVYKLGSGMNDLNNPEWSIEDLSESPSLTVEPEFVNLGKGLRLALFTPVDHDGSTKLPILMDPYGGPHAQRVIKTLRPHLISQWIADQGYFVVVADGLGTPGVDPVCEYSVYRDLATPALKSQIEALEYVKANYSFAAHSSVGVRGWSFGGYLAALCVIEAPEHFHAASAGAPVTEWELYDTHYTERYLGTPKDDPAAYEISSLTNKAHKLSRPLLLIHGLDDDNVISANSLRLSNKLFSQGIDHEFVLLDGVTHIPKKPETIAGLLRKQLAFFKRNLQQK